MQRLAARKAVKRQPFTLDEIRKLLKVAKGTEWEGIILMGLYTGQRLVDVSTLTWNQVDLEEQEITF